MDKWVKVSKKTAREFAKAILGVNAEMKEKKWGASECYYFETGIIEIYIFKDSVNEPQATFLIDGTVTAHIGKSCITIKINDALYKEADE